MLREKTFAEDLVILNKIIAYSSVVNSLLPYKEEIKRIIRKYRQRKEYKLILTQLRELYVPDIFYFYNKQLLKILEKFE